MALIVENGTGMSTAESYISVADADAYFSARNLTLWADAGFSTTEKEGCLRRATDFLTASYRGRWTGRRASTTQALDWPRLDVPRSEADGSGFYPSDAVPVEVVRACAELAWRAAFGELAPDESRRTIREKVDVIEVEYDPNAPQSTRFRVVENLLAPFVVSASGAIRLVRA